MSRNLIGDSDTFIMQLGHLICRNKICTMCDSATRSFFFLGARKGRRRSPFWQKFPQLWRLFVSIFSAQIWEGKVGGGGFHKCGLRLALSKPGMHFQCVHTQRHTHFFYIYVYVYIYHLGRGTDDSRNWQRDVEMCPRQGGKMKLGVKVLGRCSGLGVWLAPSSE